MTTWNELRTVALVGTERRMLPPAADGSPLGALPAELTVEHRALHAAALLGVARSAGRCAEQIAPPTISTAQPGAVATTHLAPNGAVQLLELMLSGNAGPGTISDSLLEQWFTRCAENDMIVPHRLLVPVLDYATTTSSLRDAARPVLGDRGAWLGAQRDRWKWAIVAPTVDEFAAGADIELDDLLQLSGDQRDAYLVAHRASDPDGGRRLIAEACTKLDAASRARVLACLRDDLGPDDEELLESALDDRSKNVRITAIALLNGLTRSARAGRLARQLEPLVSTSGRLRTTLKVDYPSPPEGEQLRDLPPDGRGVVEQQWFDAIIAGTPLSWWEDTLSMKPAKIVRIKSNQPSDLAAAWSAAAMAQHDQPWLEALFDLTKQPALLPFIGNDAAAAAFVSSVKDRDAQPKQLALLTAVAGPWSLGFSHDVIDWVRHGNDGNGAQTRANQTQMMLGERVACAAQADLTRWLDQVRGDEHKPLQRCLRNIIQQLSLRNNIDQAFT